MFDSIATLAVASNMRCAEHTIEASLEISSLHIFCRELYKLVLVDPPLAPYFSECISSEDLDEMNVEIMRNILYKVSVFFILHHADLS